MVLGRHTVLGFSTDVVLYVSETKGPRIFLTYSQVKKKVHRIYPGPTDPRPPPSLTMVTPSVCNRGAPLRWVSSLLVRVPQ